MKLSIVTINLNNRQGLKETLQSVSVQTCREFEYVVIDGASEDGSVELIRAHVSLVDAWRSEPDSGIYQAMNRGLELCRGDYCLFLNSGDRLYDERTIDRILPELQGDPVVVGRVFYPDGTGRAQMPRQLSIISLATGIVPHQAAFVRRDVVQEIGGFREDYHLISDSILFTELLVRKRIPYRTVDIPIAIYDEGGLSSTNASLVRQEHRRYLHELPHWLRWLFLCKEAVRKATPIPMWNRLKRIAGRTNDDKHLTTGPCRKRRPIDTNHYRDHRRQGSGR